MISHRNIVRSIVRQLLEHRLKTSPKPPGSYSRKNRKLHINQSVRHVLISQTGAFFTCAQEQMTHMTAEHNELKKNPVWRSWSADPHDTAETSVPLCLLRGPTFVLYCTTSIVDGKRALHVLELM